MTKTRAPRPFPGLALPLALLCGVLLAGCGGDDPPTFVDGGMDAGPMVVFDALRPPDDMGPPDARGRVCTRSTQCDDGVDCTQDICADDGRCVNVPNPTACDDEVYCNGVEQCDARRGCIAGTPIACNDNYTCTIDRCDEETKTCQHTPRDFDGDGDPDIRCRGPACGDAGVAEPDTGVPTSCWRGGDCDDTNPRVNSRLPEICGDGIDNNCNGAIDAAEPGGCRRPPHDNCDDALDVSRGGRFTVSLGGTSGDFPLRCAGNAMLQRDVVLRLMLTEPRDLTVTAQASTNAAVYLQMQSTCGAAMGTAVRECILGFPTTYRTRALPAGEYFIILGATGSVATMADVEVNVALAPATQPPTNQTCRSPQEIPAQGGTVRGSLVGVTDDIITRCGGTNPDLIYRITLPEARDLSARLTGARNEFLQVALHNTCERASTSLRCANGAPSQFLARNLAAGTYFIIVEGSRTASDFTLEVTTGAPTTPPPGDTCAAPLALTAGQTVMGSFTGFEDDYQLSCAGSNSRDLVYRFTLTETSDVTLIARGGLNAYYYMALQRTCGERPGEVACRFGAPARLSARGLDPGTYYVIVKALQGGDFTLSLDARPPLSATAVTGNDTCAAPHAIPAGGGYFTGTTATMRRDYQAPCLTGMTSDDVVFRYHVDRRARVFFSSEGSTFDTVMWLTAADACPGRNIPGACNDDAIGVAAAFDVELEPGDYYLFLAGYSTTARGPYSLLVLPTALP